MRKFGKSFASAAVAASLVVSSTASVAAAMPPAAAAPQASQASWLTLSMLTPTGAIGLAGAAAQPAADVPPPPPPPGYENSNRTLPLPVIAIWLAEIALAVYILTKNHHGHFVFPNSPG
jgi:hypothetical protein